jgi:hypothetical protein
MVILAPEADWIAKRNISQSIEFGVENEHDSWTKVRGKALPLWRGRIDEREEMTFLRQFVLQRIRWLTRSGRVRLFSGISKRRIYQGMR